MRCRDSAGLSVPTYKETPELEKFTPESEDRIHKDLGPQVPLLCLFRIKIFEVWSWEPSSVVPCFSAFGMKTAVLPVMLAAGSRRLVSSPPRSRGLGP